MSNESELIDAKLGLHDLTAHRSLEDRLAAINESYIAQLEALRADVAAHLSSYHAPEAEETKEEEHEEEKEEEEKEEEREEEEEMSEEKKPQEESKSEKPKTDRDKPPKTDHFVTKRISIFGGKK